jgi:hypothetical protein
MTADPYADVKRQVLARLRQQPRAPQAQVARNVRQTLQEVLATQDRPLTAAERVRVAQELCDIVGD